jgi:hypothetical protein
MRAYKHRNILPLYCSFVSGSQLFLVTPYMAGGSVAHILRYRFKDGLEEVRGAGEGGEGRGEAGQPSGCDRLGSHAGTGRGLRGEGRSGVRGRRGRASPAQPLRRSGEHPRARGLNPPPSPPPHSPPGPQVLIASIMRSVLCALAYIHKNGGIHRDVKVGAGRMRH